MQPDTVTTQFVKEDACHNSLMIQLTHWGRGKIAAISQTAYSNVFRE